MPELCVLLIVLLHSLSLSLSLSVTLSLPKSLHPLAVERGQSMTLHKSELINLFIESRSLSWFDSRCPYSHVAKFDSAHWDRWFCFEKDCSTPQCSSKLISNSSIYQYLDKVRGLNEQNAGLRQMK